jgi:hypothetical protein
LVYLRIGVAHGIATVYTKHAIWCCDLLCDLVRDTESHTKSHLRFGAKKDRK